MEEEWSRLFLTLVGFHVYYDLLTPTLLTRLQVVCNRLGRAAVPIALSYRLC